MPVNGPAPKAMQKPTIPPPPPPKRWKPCCCDSPMPDANQTSLNYLAAKAAIIRLRGEDAVGYVPPKPPSFAAECKYCDEKDCPMPNDPAWHAVSQAFDHSSLIEEEGSLWRAIAVTCLILLIGWAFGWFFGFRAAETISTPPAVEARH